MRSKNGEEEKDGENTKIPDPTAVKDKQKFKKIRRYPEKSVNLYPYRRIPDPIVESRKIPDPTEALLIIYVDSRVYILSSNKPLPFNEGSFLNGV